MFGQIDISVIEATLGIREWTDEEENDMTYLADKMVRVGLSMQEQLEYDCLQVLFCSGR